MKNLILLATVLMTGPAVIATEIPAGVFTGVSQFTWQNQRLSENYVRQIPQTIHNLLITSEKQFDQQNPNSCVDLTNVQYIKEFQSSNDPTINEFESSFLRIEVARCFMNTTTSKTLSTLNSLEFKGKAFPTLKTVVPNGANGFCETSSPPSLGDSHYCYKDFLDQANPHYLQLFSFNDWFEITNQYQAPVYFRESLVTTKQLGNNVLLHSVTYARGPRLSFTQRLFAKSFIANTQNTVFNSLAEELR